MSLRAEDKVKEASAWKEAKIEQRVKGDRDRERDLNGESELRERERRERKERPGREERCRRQFLLSKLKITQRTLRRLAVKCLHGLLTSEVQHCIS